MTTYELLRERIKSNEPVALATVVDGPHVGAKLIVTTTEEPVGDLGHPELTRIVARDALAELEAGRSGIRNYGPEGQTTPEDLVNTPTVRIFVESWAPPPQMWIFGAVDFTAALAKVAKVLGYRVTVCDAREVFATRRRFPMADEVVVSWPGPIFDERGATLSQRDAVCILTHDPKFDVPAVTGRARHQGRLHRCDGQPQDARQEDGAARRGRSRPARAARAADVADRARPRSQNAGRDSHLDLRRDHRPADRAGDAITAKCQRPHPRLSPVIHR